MSFRHEFVISRAALLGLLLLALPISSIAQQPAASPEPPPTLDQILTRVHENFDAYLASLPNIFADEHLVSSMSAHDDGAGNVSLNSTTDSIFRLKRSDPDATLIRLIEARQIMSIDHRPAPANQTLTGPELVSGAFSYGASFLSPELKRCYDYKLLPGRRLNKATVVVVEYVLKPSLPADILCPVSEPNSGRAFIDPVSMQIVRLEQKRPHHELEQETYNSLLAPNFASIGSGSLSESQVNIKGASGQTASMPSPSPSGLSVAAGTLGTWTWAINYAPVVINNKTFWLPKSIDSTTSTNSGRLIMWTFATKYSNYHLLTVTSKMLPGYTDVPQQ